MDLGEICWGVLSGFSWLRIGTVGGLLWVRWWTFGFWRHWVSYLSLLCKLTLGVNFVLSACLANRNRKCRLHTTTSKLPVFSQFWRPSKCGRN
jgi:hypothetical protein